MLRSDRIQRAVLLQHGHLWQRTGHVHIILDKVPVGVTHGGTAVSAQNIANRYVQLAIAMRQHQIKQGAKPVYASTAPGVELVERFFDDDWGFSGQEWELPGILPDLDHAGTPVEFPFGASAVLVKPFGEETEGRCGY